MNISKDHLIQMIQNEVSHSSDEILAAIQNRFFSDQLTVENLPFENGKFKLITLLDGILASEEIS